MGIQAATTGQLENAQRIAIEQARYTAEHNAPMTGLIERFKLAQGEKSITVPKVGQMTATALTDGVDLVNSDDIGMTTTSLTASEVGLKVILTDKLVRQENEDVFRIVGRQMGDAIARKKDTDILALFSALNGGTDLVSGTKDMELGNVVQIIGFAKANKFPNPIYIVAHPLATMHLAASHMGLKGGAMDTMNGAFASDAAAKILRNFWEINVSGIPVFQDGNITTDATDDGVGAIFSKEAMAFCESVGFNVERERDASLRATEVVTTTDYGVFELDDGYGAPCLWSSVQLLT